MLLFGTDMSITSTTKQTEINNNKTKNEKPDNRRTENNSNNIQETDNISTRYDCLDEQEYLDHRNNIIRDQEIVNKEFIRRLASDFIHYKIHGKQNARTIEEINQTNNRLPNHSTSSASSNETYEELDRKPFQKTATTMRKVSMEMEQSHAQFFDSVYHRLNLQEENAEQAFKIVSEEVLDRRSLNWGRVVSLFAFGGKVAEWFWQTQQEEKIEEVEGWLTESLSSTDGWIEENGGWDKFNETFQAPPPNKDKEQYNWLRPGLLVCAGVSLAAVLTIQSMK